MMFGSKSFDALCGVGVPRPNFQRLIAYIEPNEGGQEENLEMQLWHRRKPNFGSASSISETRMCCPEAFVRATVVEVNPQTGQPMTHGLYFHRSLCTRVLLPHPSLSRRSKVMDICQERLNQENFPMLETKPTITKLKVIWQCPGRFSQRMHHKALQTEEEPRKLTLDKATSVGGIFRSIIAKEHLSKNKSYSRRASCIQAHTRDPSAEVRSMLSAFDVELRRLLSQYGVSSAHLTKVIQRFVLKELSRNQADSQLLNMQDTEQNDRSRIKFQRFSEPSIHKDKDKSDFSGEDDSDAIITESKDVEHQAVGNASLKTPNRSLSSSLATDSQEINELSTAAGLTAAFVRRHKCFQLLARQSRSPSPL
ncbi:uncharacterized protein LOC108024151 isoform X2 [Drosophila biarmipes]|uniref:uncharacterized protein LOC108024151 isoform X2 n=1 Tax=Drosophila biarmipes TaxID=125945 RepID=UPI0007E7FB74|nr:uncharacterized protein LOC108024151 isoform X2 [Drosophila biarmipes]